MGAEVRWRHGGRQAFSRCVLATLLALLYHLAFMASPLHASDRHVGAERGLATEAGLTEMGDVAMVGALADQARDCGLELSPPPDGSPVRPATEVSNPNRTQLIEFAPVPLSDADHAAVPPGPADIQAVLQVFRI